MDWIGNNLYWTNDGYRKTISVARLETASQTRKTLLEGDMSHPRAIVVDPLNRLDKIMFHFILIQSIVLLVQHTHKTLPL